METIEIKTLVDITNTKVVRANQGTTEAYDQCRNFTTLMQCIELRCVVEYDESPTVETVDIKGMGFGSAYKGKQKVWTFTIRPDRVLAYDDGISPVGLLVNDLHEVPVIEKLTESINISKAVFDSSDPQYRNIVVEARKGTS